MTELFTASILSLIFAYYLYRWWIHPLDQLTEQLYGRREPNDADGRFERLRRAISFAIRRQQTQDATDVEDLRAEVESLTLQAAPGSDDLEEQKNWLDAVKQEIDEEKAYLEATGELADYAIKQFIGALNRGDETAIINKAANTVSFLVSPRQADHHPTTESLLTLLDETLTILTPALNRNNLRFHIHVAAHCPHSLEIDAAGFRHILLRLILAQEAPSGTEFKIEASFESGTLSLRFSKEFQVELTLTLDDLVAEAGARWQHNTLHFPATESQVLHEQQDCGLTALIVAENSYERAALSWRLKQLGVTCTSGFKTRKIDMCLVSDDSSDAFLSVKPHLDETTFILLLNSRTAVNRNYWLRLPSPLTQSSLRQAVEHIGHTRDESRQLKSLIVDDSVSNARLLGFQLTELGHAHDDAISGREALDLIEANSYQVIFMDIQMPDMNGLEATQVIRDKGIKTPVFGLTAHATSQEKEAYRAAGMDDVLIKPVRLENLKSILRKPGRLSAKPPMAAPSTQTSRNPAIFDKELALRNANHRPELATELLSILLQSLPEDQQAILDAIDDTQQLRQSVHKLHGAIRYCGVPRLARAIEKLETALKQGDDEQIPLLMNLLSGEITSLQQWYRENSDPFMQRTGVS